MKVQVRAMMFAVSSLAIAGGAWAGPVDDAMNADRAFAKMAQDKGVAEAFAAYAAPDAHWFIPGPEPLRGPQAIKDRLAKSFSSGATPASETLVSVR